MSRELYRVILIDDGSLDTVAEIHSPDGPVTTLRWPHGTIERDGTGRITAYGWRQIEADAEHEIAWLHDYDSITGTE